MACTNKQQQWVKVKREQSAGGKSSKQPIALTGKMNWEQSTSSKKVALN